MRRRLLYKKIDAGVPYSQAVAGNILCSDLTLISRNNYASSGKTAIGIVFRRTSNAIYAMSILAATAYWQSAPYDIPSLENFSDESSADNDMDGRSNTNELIYYTGYYNAGNVTNRFSTAGTSAGSWYLPAFGELKIIQQNKTEISQALQVAGGNPFAYYPCWSSTENSDTHAWLLDIENSAAYTISKRTGYYTRKVIKLTF